MPPWPNRVQANGIDLVFCCGPNMKRLFDKLPARLRGGWAEDAKALGPQIAEAMRGGDVVMVKGSARQQDGRGRRCAFSARRHRQSGSPFRT